MSLLKSDLQRYPVMFGRPNITGKIPPIDINVSKLEGAFFYDGTKGGGTTSSWITAPTTNFDASRSNGVYSRSSSVQPASLRLLFCIKS